MIAYLLQRLSELTARHNLQKKLGCAALDMERRRALPVGRYGSYGRLAVKNSKQAVRRLDPSMPMMDVPSPQYKTNSALHSRPALLRNRGRKGVLFSFAYDPPRERIHENHGTYQLDDATSEDKSN